MMVLMLKIWFLAPLCLTRNLYSTSCISLRLYFSTSCKSFFNAKFFTHAQANRSLDRSKSRLVHTHKQVNKHPQHREHHIHDSVHATLTIHLGSEPSPPSPPVSHLLAWSHCGYKSHASTNKPALTPTTSNICTSCLTCAFRWLTAEASRYYSRVSCIRVMSFEQLKPIVHISVSYEFRDPCFALLSMSF